MMALLLGHFLAAHFSHATPSGQTMAYYILPMLLFYFGVALCVSYGGTSKAVLITCSLPLVLLACLRGHTGTDTAAYYTVFTGLGSSPIDYGGEPLFGMFAQLIWTLIPDPRFVVSIISLTTASLMIWGISRARYGAWFGGLVLVPAMYFELTLNVLRFGVASSIFLIASQVPFKERPIRYLLLAVLATGMHFSSALLFILFIGVTRRGQTIWVAVSVLLVAGGALLMPGYMAAKSDLYTDMVAPNATSGLLFLLLQLSLLSVVLRWRSDFDIPASGIALCAVLAFATYIVTQFTYAGIRFQLILFYLLIVVLLRQYAPAGNRVPAQLGMWLLVIGLIGFAGRLHNMSDERGQGPSPFLPYRLAPTLEQYR
jgi:hypothetical protein